MKYFHYIFVFLIEPIIIKASSSFFLIYFHTCINANFYYVISYNFGFNNVELKSYFNLRYSCFFKIIEQRYKHTILTYCGTVLGYRCMKFALLRSKDCLCRSPERIFQEAKETLCDSEKRSNYDKWRNSGISISYKQWLGMKEHVHQVLL
jgi:hypothetical protein